MEFLKNTFPTTIAFLVSLAITSFSTVTNAQPLISCDSVVIGQIEYVATNAQKIQVPAMVTNGACISYPSFILYNQNGDTLAKETPNFFCVSFGSLGIHELDVQAGVNIPSGLQNLTLELFSGFGDTLICSWNLQVELCPADSCVYADVSLTDWHSQLQVAQVYWYLYDSTGSSQGSGVFDFNGIDRTALDSICIAPGTAYNLWVSPFTQINVFDSVMLGVSSDYFLGTGTNTYVQGDSTLDDLNFDWYANCAPITNSLDELNSTELLILHNGNHLQVSINEGRIEHLEVFNSYGQLITTRKINAHNTELVVPETAMGIHILKVRTANGKQLTRKLLFR